MLCFLLCFSSSFIFFNSTLYCAPAPSSSSSSSSSQSPTHAGLADASSPHCFVFWRHCCPCWPFCFGSLHLVSIILSVIFLSCVTFSSASFPSSHSGPVLQGIVRARILVIVSSRACLCLHYSFNHPSPLFCLPFLSFLFRLLLCCMSDCLLLPPFLRVSSFFLLSFLSFHLYPSFIL